MPFTEDTRVKIPALIHLTRLGYKYLSLKDEHLLIDSDTSILTEVFTQQLQSLNPLANPDDISQELQNIREELNFDDLGRAFYKRLLGVGEGKLKLIDWETFNNNSFHIATELTNKNGEDEFRPDITVFVNGLPLAFIEVKKPNNPEGIKAERDRIHTRFRNEKFRRFINITQVIVFSNNMEYDDTDMHKLIGAFYATTAKNADTTFNHFREQKKADFIDAIQDIDDRVENFILADNNLKIIKHSAEFSTNKDANTPTNRILSSLFSLNRLRELLRYGICYVDEVDESTGQVFIQKHIMRYPQFFATKAIKDRLDDGVNRGVIWHTQGSGKTALAYYSVLSLQDYYAKRGEVPKFYFIVDRLDLANQAKDEFSKRGFAVRTISSKEALLRDFGYNATTEGITVVNIHKFREDTLALRDSGYSISVRRVFFIDEAHRSYDPHGSFLANLYNSDHEAVKIALTGTPLIIYKDHDQSGGIRNSAEKEDSKTTRNIFGQYIHKYYYNDSIRDGYTLKLLREEIETSYKEKVRGILERISLDSDSIDRQDLFAHHKFVSPMLDYITTDFLNSRIRYGEKTIGGLIVADSSKQARQLFSCFTETAHIHHLKAALILHDENDSETRKAHTKAFKEGKIDILIVYSMLLTGFDAPRLKKLYLGRKIRAHNLLQTLTRVNRPFKNFKIGYVVDFADISREFEITNQAYFRELTAEYSDNLDDEDPNSMFGSLFMTKEEIDDQFSQIETAIADFSTDNKETFSSQISAIDDRSEILGLKNALESARDLYNIARLLGYTELLAKLDFKMLAELLTMVSNRLKLLNLKEAMNDVNSKELLNTTIEDVVFSFTKTGEEELRLLSEDLHQLAGRVRRELDKNLNKDDQEWISLYQSFVAILHQYHIDPESESLDEMRFESEKLKQIFDQIRELNRRNAMLLAKFGGDRKFAIVFKQTQPSGKVSDNLPLFNLLRDSKDRIDSRLSQNQNLLTNKGYFKLAVGEELFAVFQSGDYQIPAQTLQELIEHTADEYLHEYQGD